MTEHAVIQMLTTLNGIREDGIDLIFLNVVTALILVLNLAVNTNHTLVCLHTGHEGGG